MVVMDELSAEFAKERTLLKEDVSSLIQEAIKPLQSAMDSLQSTIKFFQGRLTSVESVAGDNFERLTLAESTFKTLQNHNHPLLDQINDLENHLQRANLRILNIPEGSEVGKDPVKIMSGVLLQVTGLNVFPAPSELERTHRTPPSRSSTFLVCFSRFQQKEAASHWARNHNLKYQGTTIRVYQDLSAERAAFNGVKQALYWRNVRLHLLYPARLLMLCEDDVFIFDSTDETQRFFDQRLGKE